MTKSLPSMLRLCRLIRWGGATFVIGILMIYLITWFWPGDSLWPDSAMLRLHLAGLPANALASLSVVDRLLVSMISLPYLATLIWAFYRLNRMLKGFERGEFFERETVSHLRAFSGYLFLAKIFALIAMHARVSVMGHLLGQGRMAGHIELSSDDMAVLLMCALFFLIARMMEEARRLAEENKEFI